MTDRSIRRLLATSLIALGLLPAAVADSRGAKDISGVWMFKTEVLPNKGCVIAGEITFKQTSAGVYECAFVSTEYCAVTFQTVQQACTARQVGDDQILILSRVEKIVDAGPKAYRLALLDPETYSSDNFRVRLKGGELIGTFFSRREAGVRFWRKDGLVS